MEFLWEGLLSITWQQAVMYVVGAVLIWLAIKKDYEPSLLLPMGFGAILVNLPSSGVLNQVMEGVGETHGIIQWPCLPCWASISKTPLPSVLSAPRMALPPSW